MKDLARAEARGTWDGWIEFFKKYSDERPDVEYKAYLYYDLQQRYCPAFTPSRFSARSLKKGFKPNEDVLWAISKCVLAMASGGRGGVIFIGIGEVSSAEKIRQDLAPCKTVGGDDGCWKTRAILKGDPNWLGPPLWDGAPLQLCGLKREFDFLASMGSSIDHWDPWWRKLTDWLRTLFTVETEYRYWIRPADCMAAGARWTRDSDPRYKLSPVEGCAPVAQYPEVFPLEARGLPGNETAAYIVVHPTPRPSPYKRFKHVAGRKKGVWETGFFLRTPGGGGQTRLCKLTDIETWSGEESRLLLQWLRDRQISTLTRRGELREGAVAELGGNIGARYSVDRHEQIAESLATAFPEMAATRLLLDRSQSLLSELCEGDDPAIPLNIIHKGESEDELREAWLVLLDHLHLWCPQAIVAILATAAHDRPDDREIAGLLEAR